MIYVNFIYNWKSVDLTINFMMFTFKNIIYDADSENWFTTDKMLWNEQVRDIM